MKAKSQRFAQHGLPPLAINIIACNHLQCVETLQVSFGPHRWSQALTSSSAGVSHDAEGRLHPLAEAKGRRKRTTTNALRFECNDLWFPGSLQYKLLKMDKLKSFHCWNCWKSRRNCWTCKKNGRCAEIAQKSWGRCHGLDTRLYTALLFRRISTDLFVSSLWQNILPWILWDKNIVT